MSYELERDEPLADGIQRVVVEQVDTAIHALAIPRVSGDVDGAVHEARKCFKRVRSALRMVPLVVSRKACRRENARFRKLGMSLAGPRESAVAILTIHKLSDQFHSLVRPRAFRELHAHFVEQRTRALWETVESEGALRQVVRKLGRARRRLGTLPTCDSSDLAWVAGVRQSYGAGRSRMAEAYVQRAPEAFHEWRKQAKHLRYHLWILRGAWSGQLDPAAELLHDLTDLLGFHHDLTDLRRQLDQHPETRTTPRRRAESEMLRVLIDGQRVALESEARAVGERIYSRKPKTIVKRIRSCWDQWRSVP